MTEAETQRLEEILESEETAHTEADLELILWAIRQHPEETYRHNSMRQLMCWDERGERARAVLLEAVREWDDSSDTKSELLEVIQNLMFSDDQMVDAIAEHIHDRGYFVADGVAYTLGVLGNPTPKVLQALEHALSTGPNYWAEDFIRASAAWALGNLGVSSPSILRGLQHLARREDATSKEVEAATEALEKLGGS
jgi:HEAT repeat protein